MQFSLSALTSGLSAAISVGCGLKTSSISSFSPNSEPPSPSVSTFESFPSVRLHSTSLLLSLSSERSEVRIDLALLNLLLVPLLKLDGTGDGVLRTDGGFDVCRFVSLAPPDVVSRDAPLPSPWPAKCPPDPPPPLAEPPFSKRLSDSLSFRDLFGRFCDWSLIPSVMELTIETCE